MERRTHDNPDAQQVCLGGHQITSHYYDQPDERREHCRKCGKGTIHTRPSCNTDIPGGHYFHRTQFVSQASSRHRHGPQYEWHRVDRKEVPPYCEECGEPFPWTMERIAAEQAAAALEQRDGLRDVERLCNRFHTVACQLRRRHDNRETLVISDVISDEYDAQDLLHALLRLFFDDVRAEEATPSYAGGSSRMDFLLKKERLGLEVKKTRPGLTAGALGGQLIEDAGRFAAHPDCETLVCLVYDPDDLLQNPQGIMDDLSSERDGLNVRALIVPRRH